MFEQTRDPIVKGMWEYIIIGVIVVFLVVILFLWLSSSSSKNQTTSKEVEIMGDFGLMEEYSIDYCNHLHHLLLCRRRGEDVARIKSNLDQLSESMNKVLTKYYILGDQYGNLIKEKAEIIDRQMIAFMKCTYAKTSEGYCPTQAEEQKVLNNKLIDLLDKGKQMKEELLKAFTTFDAEVAEVMIAINSDKLVSGLERSRNAAKCLKLINATLFVHASASKEKKEA